MKRIILLFLFILKGFLFNAQSVADYTIYYNFKCVSDTIENEFFTPEEFILYRVGHESRFVSSGRYYNDSTTVVFEKTHPQPMFNSQEEVQKYIDLIAEKRDRKNIQSDYRITKNFETSNFTSLLIFSLPIQYQEETMNFLWEITNETDTILGLPCIKAFTNYGGRHYFAWFTLAVPINDGPYVFQGLPGLILKVIDDRGWYNFVVTNIITEKTNRYWNPEFMNKFSQKIDRKTFVSKMTELKRNPQMPAEVLNFSEEARLKRKKAYEKRFDFLIEQN